MYFKMNDNTTYENATYLNVWVIAKEVFKKK